MRAFSLMAIVAAPLLAGACASFEDVTTVIDLRVLGIKAEPPEIYVDKTMLATQTDPFFSVFTALVVDPHGAGRPVSFTALACPREIDTVTAATGRNGVVCEHNVPGMTPTSLDIPGTPAQTSGPGPEHDIMFLLTVPPPLLEYVFDKLDPFGAQGFQLPIVVQLELAAGTESIVATKRVIFSQQLMDRPPQLPNQNPTPAGIRVYPARDAQRMPIAPMMFDQGSITLPPSGQLWFEPIGTPRESYSAPELTRENPPQVITRDVAQESLRFAFFASAGRFAPPETTTIKSVLREDPGPPHLESQYTAPARPPEGGVVTIWIVSHDERGGADWVQRQLTISAAP